MRVRPCSHATWSGVCWELGSESMVSTPLASIRLTTWAKPFSQHAKINSLHIASRLALSSRMADSMSCFIAGSSPSSRAASSATPSSSSCDDTDVCAREKAAATVGFSM